MNQIVRALIDPDGDGYVEIPDVKAFAQGDTIEDAPANAREAIALALDGEDSPEFGLAPDPSLIATIELGSLYHVV